MKAICLICIKIQNIQIKLCLILDFLNQNKKLKILMKHYKNLFHLSCKKLIKNNSNQVKILLKMKWKLIKMCMINLMIWNYGWQRIAFWKRQKNKDKWLIKAAKWDTLLLPINRMRDKAKWHSMDKLINHKTTKRYTIH